MNNMMKVKCIYSTSDQVKCGREYYMDKESIQEYNNIWYMDVYNDSNKSHYLETMNIKFFVEVQTLYSYLNGLDKEKYNLCMIYKDEKFVGISYFDEKQLSILGCENLLYDTIKYCTTHEINTDDIKISSTIINI